MPEVVGWCAVGLAVWCLLGLPIAMVVGRRLRDHQPPPPDPGEEPPCR